MPPSSTATSARPATTISEPVAGVVGGLVAGVAYLAAQISFTTAAGGSPAEPLQRIAAVLMGPDVAPPPAEFSFPVFGMALIIHFALAIVFGRIVSALAWRRGTGAGVLVGACVGVAVFALDFLLIAPSVFPWFDESVRSVTLIDHVLFGVVAAFVALTLRDRSR